MRTARRSETPSAGSAMRYAENPRRKRNELVSMPGVRGLLPILHT
jgi:hypothetical protein